MKRYLYVLGVVAVLVFGYFAYDTVGDSTIGLTLTTNPDLERGLVGHWTFDGPNMDWSSSTAEVRDRSGRNNHGDADSDMSNERSVPGVIGQAIRFNGESQEDDIGLDNLDDFDFSQENAFTLAAWVRHDDVSANNAVIFSRGDAYSSAPSLAYTMATSPVPDNGRLQMRLSNGSDFITIITDPGVLTKGEWQHLALSWNGTDLTLFRNGVFVDETSSSTFELWDPTTAVFRETAIGAAGRGEGDNWQGELDDVRAYNRALSDAEIVRLYELGATARVAKTLSTNPDLARNLIGHWTFDGRDIDWSDTVEEVKDASGNGNHGNANAQLGVARSSVPGVLGQGLFFTTDVPETIVLVREQYATNDGDPASATFGATPTEGNLLVAIAMERSGTTEANYTISGTGWTKRVGRDTELSDVNARRSMAIWTKVAGASEPTNVQVDNGTGNDKRLLIQEFSAGIISPTWTFQATSSNDTGTGSASPLSTGSTGSVSDDDLLLLTAAIWRNESGDPGAISWTNGISDTVSALGGTNGRSINSGFVATTTGGTKSSSVSWTGSGHEASAAILVFSVGGAGESTVYNVNVGIGDVGTGVQTVAFWMYAGSTTVSVLELDGITFINATSGTLAATGFTSPTIYVDGVESSSITAGEWHHVTVTTGTGISASDMNIGKVGDVGFDGTLDDVRIYTRALSAAEVQRLYEPGATTRIAKTITTNPDLERGLLGHWTFDGDSVDIGSSTGEILDRAGTYAAGDWVDHATTTIPGRLGQAVAFDGIDDEIQVPNFDPPHTGTVAFWVNVGSDDEYRILGWKDDYEVIIEEGTCPSPPRFANQLFANGLSGVCSNTVVEENVWTHVVSTYDFTTNAQQIYINGELDNSNSDADDDPGGPDTLTIGNRTGDTGEEFNGALDDVRIYNRVLSAAEVKRLYEQGR